MRFILKYFIDHFRVLFLLAALLPLGSSTVLGQFKSDTLYGIRLGVDVSRIPLHFVERSRTDFEVHGDARLDTNLYVAVELGWNTTNFDNEPIFHYKSNGAFIKAGIDYNLLKPIFPSESNMVYVGFRYGIAQMSREVPMYTVKDSFWGDQVLNFPSKSLLPQWIEGIIGLKVEVLPNLFMDWGLHLRLLTTPNIDKDFKPYMIPGYGKGNAGAVFDVNYTISYRIPLWKP